MKEQNYTWQVVCETTKILIMMTCAIVGVGFVSGAEIFEFYVRFKQFFILGVIVFFCLLFVLSRKVLFEFVNDDKCFKMQKSTKKYAKNTILVKNQIKQFLLWFNCLLVSSAMFSGLNVLLKKIFFNNYIWVLLLSLVIIIFVVWIGVRGLKNLDYFVFLFMVFLTLFFIKNIFFNNVNEFDFSVDVFDFKNCFGSIFFATLYVFMNIIQIHPILTEMDVKFSKKRAVVMSVLFSIFLTAILLSFCLFLRANNSLFSSEMPYLDYFDSAPAIVKVIFNVGLLFALVSSLIGSLFGVKRGVVRKFDSNIFASICSVVVAFALSFFGFKFYVSIVYPLIGIINFVIFVFL